MPTLTHTAKCLRAMSVILLIAVTPANGIDQVRFDRNGDLISVVGTTVVSAQDGGMLLLGHDGQLWSIQPTEIRSQESDDAPFVAITAAALQKELANELPGFRFHKTAHFLIAYNTSQAYAQWCGGLYERLYRAFVNYWRRRGIELTAPQFPLVAIAFASKQDYSEYAAAELGDTSSGIVGYYSLKTNRVAMYDLTGVEGLRTPSGRGSNTQRINRVLSQPAAEPSVATLVHEATHQVAYNVGLQTRYADNPLWLSEGLAVYFETPDLSSSKGWRGIGRINSRRLQQLHRYFENRPSDSLVSLISDDTRLRNGDSAADAYAEAWGLCYFLLKRREAEFAAYVDELSELRPLKNVSAADRIEVFTTHFGDLTDLDRRFANEMQALRVK